MKFSKWLRIADEEYINSFKEKYKGKSILPGNAFEWHKDAWFMYMTLESNKKLIWATWTLVISTIILSVLTLYVKNYIF